MRRLLAILALVRLAAAAARARASAPTATAARLPGAGDLRQRGLRRARRGREGGRRQGRRDRVDGRDRRQEGGGRPARSRTAGFAPFRADAQCTVRPQSLIGEKFVECEPGRRRSAERWRRSTTATARASTCCRWSRHQLAGGPRPGQQHPAPALPRAPRDPARRVRHGPGGPRRGPQRGDPPRQPGAARDRPRARDPGRPEPACWPKLARDSDEALAPLAREKRAGHRTSSSRPTRPARPPPSAATTSSAGIQRLPALPARAAPADGRPRRLRRRGHARWCATSTPPAPDVSRLIERARARSRPAPASRSSASARPPRPAARR